MDGEGARELDAGRRLREVDLRPRDDARKREERRRPRAELGDQRIVFRPRIGGRHVDQEAEDARPLEVLEEPDPETTPFRRALDQAGHVRHHERALRIRRDDAEVRREGGERIVGDPRPGRAHAREERRLPGVRAPDEPHVGEELELERDPPPLPRLAVLRVTRCLASRTHEERVSLPAAPAPRNDRALARAREIRERLPRPHGTSAQMVLRVGYGRTAGRTPRRPLDQILTGLDP